MSDQQKLPFIEHVLNEIWDEMSLLEGRELDEFLGAIGLDVDELLQHYEQSAEGVEMALKRSRYEAARRHVRDQLCPASSKVASLTEARKQEILTVIKHRTAETGEMTMAARNQRIESEEDLDSFLEACVRLG